MGEILAVAARVNWLRRDEDASHSLAQAGDQIVEALVELPSASREPLAAAFLGGVREGHRAFHGRSTGPAGHSQQPNATGRGRDLRRSGLLVLDFQALRLDARKERRLSELEMSRAAICMLSALRETLPCAAIVHSLGWSPGRGGFAFGALSEALLERERALPDGQSTSFPAEHFPELARRMEALELGRSAGPATSPSSRLRM